jgi:F-type H+-transporting ATPase subunit epsilon
MYERPFSLQVITPTGMAYQGQVLSITAPGVLGSFQILYNHAAMLSELAIGEVKVMDSDGKQIRYAVSGGFLEVKKNSAVVLVDAVEEASAIDVVRATRARERASSRLRSKDPTTDVERARLAMMRALNRLRVAARASS